VPLTLVRADLTGGDLRSRLGEFDLLVDYGTLDGLSADKRDRYLSTVLPLARPGAEFLLWCFEWPVRRRDRWLRIPAMRPGEVERRPRRLPHDPPPRRLWRLRPCSGNGSRGCPAGAG
jgi:hypothetical protein